MKYQLRQGKTWTDYVVYYLPLFIAVIIICLIVTLILFLPQILWCLSTPLVEIMK